MRSPRFARRPAVIATVLALAVAIPSAPAASTIGLYADQNGGSCSFSGNDAGLITAYVVMKPDAAGLRGVRFSAPVPACLGAVMVEELPAPGAFSIGEVATGVSVAVPFCAGEPSFVYQISYMRTSTDPCCAYPILEDPFVGMIEGTDCVFEQVTLTGSTARFNADETCPCRDGQAPYPPHTPFPADYAEWIETTPTFTWMPSQYDGDIVEYDVYVGTDPTPALVATVAAPAYLPAQALLPSTQHFWRVVARDVEGLETSSALWRFTTRSGNFPPSAPTNPSPANGAVNVPTSLTLSWICGDPDGEALRYDVYFGDTSPPPLVSSNLVAALLSRPNLSAATVYHWRVVARDEHGAETSGPQWAFTTRATNTAPNLPVATSPNNGAINVAINALVQWSCSDPDGDALTYDVYFGTTNPPPLAAGNHATTSFNPGTLSFLTTFYWKIVARDPSGLETAGAVWSFTTRANAPPGVPSNPSPSNNAVNVSLTPSLNWTATDEFTSSLRYDVYFGTTSPPPLVASNITTRPYGPGTLTVATAYYWKVVARDAQNLETAGPVWLFTTLTNPAAQNPSPPNNGVGSNPLLLSWQTTDPLTRPILCDVYFGTTTSPPLVASNVQSTFGNGTGFDYSPGINLVAGTRYYWKVFAHSTYGGTMGPDWSFVAGLRGDVDGDGVVDTDDAACALQIALSNPSCAAPGSLGLADVNCVAGVTPRDALCIHRHAIGQTCLFCGEQLGGGEALVPPIVTRTALWQTGNTIYATLAVSGVPAFEAFSFWVRYPLNAPLVSAVRRSATGGFTALDFHALSTSAVVGGYSLNAVNASSTTDFIELRFQLGGALVGFIYADTFVDDLAGAALVGIASGSGKGGGLPVLFSRFDAMPDGDGVRIAWEFQHDDALDGYAIYRGIDGATPTVSIVDGPVTATRGSYVDHNVQPGRTYRYEMAVRTSDGDEFRSPIATVEMPGNELTLGANRPNPFNPQTTIPYTLPVGSAPVRVRLAIYDTSGRLVRVLIDEMQAGGAREVVWRGDGTDGKTVTSGVYFSVLQVGNERRTRKLVLLK